MADGRKYRRRDRRTGGVKFLREDVWRVDLELPRQADEPRRRVSRTVEGTKVMGISGGQPLLLEFPAVSQSAP